MNNLNIRKVLLGAFGYVYEYRTDLAKALFIPTVAILLLSAIPIQELGATQLLALIVSHLVIYVLMAITTHRVILLGPSSVPVFGINIPRKRELLFALYLIGAGIIVLPFSLLVKIPDIGRYIAMAASFYVLSRLSLVFPAIAIDQRRSFYDSWKATHSHQVLMIAVGIIFPSVISIPRELLDKIPYISVLVNLLSIVTMVLVIAALSVAFQVITEKCNES